jgi:hypothetical protein
LRRFSLLGIIKHVEFHAREYDTRSERARLEFTTRIHPFASKDPYKEVLPAFPFPVQVLMELEIKAGEKMSGQEDQELLVSSAPKADSQGNTRPPVCGRPCKFFQQWQLPCRHIWRQHILFRVLSKEAVQQFSFVWAEGGFEHYENSGTRWVERDAREAIGAPVRQRLDLREVLDALVQQYYHIEEQVRSWEHVEADQFVVWWINELSKRTGAMEQTGLEEFMARINLGGVGEEGEGGEGGLHQAGGTGGSGTADWEAQLSATAAYADKNYDLAAAQADPDADGPPPGPIGSPIGLGEPQGVELEDLVGAGGGGNDVDSGNDDDI